MAIPRTEHKKRRLGNIPFMGVFFSMTLALLILGVFGLLVLLGSNLASEIRGNVEMQVFLRKNISENEIITIRSTLSEMDFVARVQGRPRITFVSKEQAAQTFSQDIGEDFVRYIGANPLSDLLIVQVADTHQSPEQFRNIKAKIESLRGVLEAAYVEKLVESIYNNLTKLSVMLVGLMVLLFTAVIIIVYHAIRLAMFSQRFLIRSMQLVGATGSFIKRPFLFCAIFYGFLAATMAAAGLYGLLLLAERQIPHLSLLQHPEQMLLLFVGIFVVGLFTSYYSTRSAVGRYLRMSLDDLY